jgi:hypothetical protein
LGNRAFAWREDMRSPGPVAVLHCVAVKGAVFASRPGSSHKAKAQLLKF